VGLILFKTLDLWFPKITGAPTLKALPEVEFNRNILVLERGLTALSIIASTAPFVGLMGTVLHIMEALSRISTSLDTSVISGPIATALNATLIGLVSAIPAAAAYALFVRRLQVLESRSNTEQG
jgi:biopolymer transport protein ExbB/TolQ